MISDCAAVILAGGQGRRLGGCVKPLLEIDGRRIIDRQLEVLRRVAAPIALSVRDQNAALTELQLPLVRDDDRYQGPLGGIAAALAWSPQPWLLVVAGDMPLLAADVLHLLGQHRAGVELVCPEAGGSLQPLCALYSRRCLTRARALLAAGQRSVQALVTDPSLRTAVLSERQLRVADADLSFLTNLNTPQDLPC